MSGRLQSCLLSAVALVVFLGKILRVRLAQLVKHFRNIQLQVFCIIPQVAARLHRRWHHGQIVRFQRPQVLHTDSRGFENLFEGEALDLTSFFESLADGCHVKENITSPPSNGYELVMS